VLSSTVERSFRLERQGVWLLAVHDAISFAVFVSSFFGTVVAWRGCGYRILRDGTIEEEN
jgi:ceramide glucosyltransferase